MSRLVTCCRTLAKLGVAAMTRFPFDFGTVLAWPERGNRLRHDGLNRASSHYHYRFLLPGLSWLQLGSQGLGSAASAPAARAD